jgi:hypothetical protein
MSSTGFGQWYEEKKQEDGPEGGSSWFGGLGDMEGLPLFNSETMQSFSFSGMQQSMEAQMPKKILGMGYQQRFQVGRRTNYLFVLVEGSGTTHSAHIFRCGADRYFAVSYSSRCFSLLSPSSWVCP